MKDKVLLDNKTTVKIFCNLNMVTDIYDTNEKSLDLVTNAKVPKTIHFYHSRIG